MRNTRHASCHAHRSRWQYSRHTHTHTHINRSAMPNPAQQSLALAHRFPWRRVVFQRTILACFSLYSLHVYLRTAGCRSAHTCTNRLMLSHHTAPMLLLARTQCVFCPLRRAVTAPHNASHWMQSNGFLVGARATHCLRWYSRNDCQSYWNSTAVGVVEVREFTCRSIFSKFHRISALPEYGNLLAEFNINLLCSNRPKKRGFTCHFISNSTPICLWINRIRHSRKYGMPVCGVSTAFDLVEIRELRCQCQMFTAFDSIESRSFSCLFHQFSSLTYLIHSLSFHSDITHNLILLITAWKRLLRLAQHYLIQLRTLGPLNSGWRCRFVQHLPISLRWIVTSVLANRFKCAIRTNILAVINQIEMRPALEILCRKINRISEILWRN